MNRMIFFRVGDREFTSVDAQRGRRNVRSSNFH